jgi:aldose 1-epimerase
MEQKVVGKISTGEEISEFTIQNENGLILKVITFGGIITELHVPDKYGKLDDVVLGFGSVEDYEKFNVLAYFGCITGRVAGRITHGKFSLEGKEYQMVINNEPNHLHGGLDGLNKQVWSPKILDDQTLQLSYTSPDGQSGYPGNVEIAVTYALTSENEVRIEYHAKTDKATPLSLTNHAYFNLAGQESCNSLDHLIQINCSDFVPTDEDMTLQDRIESVEGKGNDVRKMSRLGDVIPKLLKHHGDNYMVKLSPSQDLVHVAKVIEPVSGRVMDAYCTDQCLQFYTGMALDEEPIIGKTGKEYVKHHGFCLEFQGYPNGVNHPEIADNVLKLGETYKQTSVYRFSTER